MNLREVLPAIIESEYKMPASPTPFEIAQAMLAHIGDPDPHLRDELIYPVLAKWIEAGNVFSAAEMCQIVATLIDDDHLFSGIGEKDTDSVFRRSFSALQLPVSLIAHNKNAFLSHDDVMAVKAALLRYLATEQDKRGYAGDKGWAHAVAHTADALDDLCQCSELTADDLIDLLNAARDVMGVGTLVYNCEEDERMAYAVNTLLQQGKVGTTDVVAWLKSCVALLKDGRKEMPAFLFRNQNMKQFLRSLYFRTESSDLDPAIHTALAEAVRAARRF
jgi:hypothetical protein